MAVQLSDEDVSNVRAAVQRRVATGTGKRKHPVLLQSGGVDARVGGDGPRPLCDRASVETTAGDTSSSSLVAAASLSNAPHNDMAELQVACIDQQDTIGQLKKQLRAEQVQRSKAEYRVVERDRKIQTLEEELSNLRKQVVLRSGARAWVNLYGGYTMGIAHAMVSAAASTVARLVAGREVCGGVQDPNTVWRFGERAAVAHRLRSSDFYGVMCQAPEATYQCIGYRGDGTQDETVENRKLHVSIIEAASFRMADLDLDPASIAIETNRSAGDLQSLEGLKNDSGALYQIVEAQLRSVSAPLFSEDVLHGSRRTYIFGLDNGPENNFTKRVKSTLQGKPWISS